MLSKQIHKQRPLDRLGHFTPMNAQNSITYLDVLLSRRQRNSMPSTNTLPQTPSDSILIDEMVRGFEVMRVWAGPVGRSKPWSSEIGSPRSGESLRTP